jgi:hypothetical protein
MTKRDTSTGKVESRDHNHHSCLCTNSINSISLISGKNGSTIHEEKLTGAILTFIACICSELQGNLFSK